MQEGLFFSSARDKQHLRRRRIRLAVSCGGAQRMNCTAGRVMGVIQSGGIRARTRAGEPLPPAIGSAPITIQAPRAGS